MKQMLLWIFCAVLSPALQAQPLSPPLESQPVAPLGTGPGFHSPQSPIAPLKERDDLVSWKLLASVKTKTERNRVKPLFPDGVRALNKRTVKIQGFMMPLEPGDKQKHFLLSAVPTSCAFCVPAGPEGLVEVKTRTPVRYSIDPVVVEGQLAVLDNDPYGIFYRIVDGVPSK
ncbi:DUF3299 domain-containing protein [Schlegelella sp. S2-27]|uniref:DUF3299 domain-containing protein n=1 Tax=Caldimonas mangrovi TaxID=2944811 RepID=A0ABT0YLR4_9BURK|nr:DUF3299 domain-containing protein [Caldimonas mangrovi]MCM5679671.1 DUF3299 domain-containing protein [Caldimonas mangrovi]